MKDIRDFTLAECIDFQKELEGMYKCGDIGETISKSAYGECCGKLEERIKELLKK